MQTILSYFGKVSRIIFVSLWLNKAMSTMQYNTQLKKLCLPEYGRNIQQMVELCMTIEDRDERNSCAYSIVSIMKRLFPELSNDSEQDLKIWDIINILADFKLDVDFPEGVAGEESMNPKPEKIPYPSGRIRLRHYGRNIERMVDTVANMEEGKLKDDSISMLANHMKKLMLLNNKEGVDDAKILRDLADYSHGKINLDPATYTLKNFVEAPTPQKNQPTKKKKKK